MLGHRASVKVLCAHLSRLYLTLWANQGTLFGEWQAHRGHPTVRPPRRRCGPGAIPMEAAVVVLSSTSAFVCQSTEYNLIRTYSSRAMTKRTVKDKPGWSSVHAGSEPPIGVCPYVFGRHIRDQDMSISSPLYLSAFTQDAPRKLRGLMFLPARDLGNSGSDAQAWT